MRSIFDVEKLNGLLRDFYRISRIRITVFDEALNELFSYPDAVAPYCSVIRGTREGYDACMNCDRAACEKAAKTRGTETYRCHAGLTEAVTPLYIGDVLAGYLLFGHVFSYPDHESGIAEIERCTSSLPIDKALLRGTLRDARPTDDDYVRSAAQILRAVALCVIMDRMATLKDDPIAVRLDAFISEHYTQKLCSAGIASSINVGKTRLYELSRQLYGCPVAEHIRDLRIKKAKALLSQRKDLTLAQISSLCGYDDYNYFITVFTRTVGVSPGAWRKR